jgi:hypothetical protein
MIPFHLENIIISSRSTTTTTTTTTTTDDDGETISLIEFQVFGCSGFLITSLVVSDFFNFPLIIQVPFFFVSFSISLVGHNCSNLHRIYITMTDV